MTGGALALFGGLSVYYMHLQERNKERTSLSGRLDRAKNILALKLPKLRDDIVHRESIEKSILQHGKSRFDTVVVSGPRGVGKSTLVSAAFKDQMVKPSAANMNQICSMILEKCGVILTKDEENQSDYYLSDMLEDSKEKSKEGKVPSIILDINETITTKQLKSLLSFCKVVGDESNLVRFL